MLNQAEVNLLVKVRDAASKALAGIKGNVEKLGGAMKTGLKVGAVVGAAGIVGLGFAMKDFVGEAIEAQQVMAQTNAVLASTKGAAGLSAGEISNMASALSKVTTFSDDTIQSGQNILLTFTKIGRDVFPQATETILDMSTALGQDLQSSAIQLGKALNDPIQGVTALRRVGVSFTQSQLEQIRALQESGDLMGAQKIILQELSTEFGNSARAAGETFGGKMAILKNQIGELKESIGLALLPVLTKLADVAIQYAVPALESGLAAATNFSDFIRSALTGDLAAAGEALNKLPAPLQTLALWLVANKETIDQFAAAARTLGEDVLKGLGLILQDVTGFFADHREMLILVGVAVAALLVWMYAIPVAIAAIIAVVALVRLHWNEWKQESETLRTVLAGLSLQFDILRAVLTPLLDALKLAVQFVRDHESAQLALKIALVAAITTMMPFIAVTYALGKAADTIRAAWDAVTGALRTVGGAIEVVVGLFVGLPGRILGAIGDLSGLLFDAGKQLIQGLIDGVTSKFDAVKDTLGDLTGKITSWKGPPAEDAVLLYDNGALIMDGLIAGIDSKRDELMNALQAIAADVSKTWDRLTKQASTMAHDMGKAINSVSVGAGTGGLRIPGTNINYAFSGNLTDAGLAKLRARDPILDTILSGDPDAVRRSEPPPAVGRSRLTPQTTNNYGPQTTNNYGPRDTTLNVGLR